MSTAAERAEIARQITVLADRRDEIPRCIAHLQAEYVDVARQLVALTPSAADLTGALTDLLTAAAADVATADGG